MIIHSDLSYSCEQVPSLVLSLPSILGRGITIVGHRAPGRMASPALSIKCDSSIASHNHNNNITHPMHMIDVLMRLIIQ